MQGWLVSLVAVGVCCSGSPAPQCDGECHLLRQLSPCLHRWRLRTAVLARTHVPAFGYVLVMTRKCVRVWNW